MQGFGEWHGADVVVATGWETVYAALLLPSCHARAYLVQDHEPDFFPESARRLWAEQTYGFGLYPIAASRWLRDLLARRYGANGSWFRLGVDHGTYQPAAAHAPRRHGDLLRTRHNAAARRPARPACARGAAPPPPGTPDRHVRAAPSRSTRPCLRAARGRGAGHSSRRAYAEARVGLCLSLTNYSLIPQEMMACGLPCVDVRGGSSEAEFGSDGSVELADRDPVAARGRHRALLENEGRWSRRSRAGLDFVADADWDHAALRSRRGYARRFAGTSASTLPAGRVPRPGSARERLQCPE